MATLVSLQNLYEKVRQEERDYWKELRHSLEDVFVSVSKMLGVDSDKSEFFSVGVVNSDGDFRRASVRQLTMNERSFEFTLQLTLSQDPSLTPPNAMRTEWSARKTAEGLELKEKGGRPSSFEHPNDAAKYVIEAFEKKISSFSPYVL